VNIDEEPTQDVVKCK